MESSAAQRPGGPCFVLAVNSTASPSATKAQSPDGGDVTYEFYNSGDNDAFIGYGSTSTVASSNASIPIVGTPVGSCFPVASGCYIVKTLSPDLFLAGITGLGSSSVFVTTGYGL